MRSLFLILFLMVSTASYAGNEIETGKAISWLELVDAGNYSASWDEAAPFFQEKVSSSQWVEALNAVRAPLGDVTSREVTSATAHTILPEAPPGEYIVLTLTTSYANKAQATETVTLMRVGDDWRVVGYFIK